MIKKNLNATYIKKILEENKNLLREHSVKKIGLFGSFLYRNHKKSSDIDFIVVFNKPTFDNYMGLKFLLEKLFNKKVDLVTESSLKPALKYVKEEAIYAKRI